MDLVLGILNLETQPKTQQFACEFAQLHTTRAGDVKHGADVALWARAAG
jgi:hypothetical protein